MQHKGPETKLRSDLYLAQTINACQLDAMTEFVCIQYETRQIYLMTFLTDIEIHLLNFVLQQELIHSYSIW